MWKKVYIMKGKLTISRQGSLWYDPFSIYTLMMVFNEDLSDSFFQLASFLGNFRGPLLVIPNETKHLLYCLFASVIRKLLFKSFESLNSICKYWNFRIESEANEIKDMVTIEFSALNMLQRIKMERNLLGEKSSQLLDIVWKF